MIFIASQAVHNCTVYSPSLTDGVLYLPNGAQDVILHCLCTAGSIATGPTFWSRNNAALLTQVNGNNAYYRNNVPAPLIIPNFAAVTHNGSYICTSSPRIEGTQMNGTVILASSGMCNFISKLCVALIKVNHS